MKVQGTVEAKKKDGTAIKVGEAWYSAYKGKGLERVNAGDTVRFEFSVNGNFNNIDAKTVQVKKGDNPTPAASGPAPKFNQIGVELGHAANLAMQYSMHANDLGFALDEWEETTKEIFLRMKSLRAQAEVGFTRPQKEQEDYPENDSAFADADPEDDIFE